MSAIGGSHERLGWIWRVGGVLVLLLVLVIAGLMFYASTPHFANLVRLKVITVLEDATGGRVEIAVFALELAPSRRGSGWPDHPWSGGPG